jgi:N-acetylneuraminic acid mutarotase
MSMKKIMFVQWVCAMCFCCNNLFAASAWNQKANFGGEARHRAIGFSIGNRGYMGLGHVNSVVDVLYEDIWEYDPGTNSWTQKANFGGGFRFHAVAFSIGNKGYVGTGRVPSGLYENDLWEYDPVTNVWTQKTDMPALERRGAVAFVVNGEGYIGTGQTTSGNVDDFMKYNPTTDSWAPVATFIGFARTSAVGFAINNKGYVGTGGANDFYEYDPLTDSWSVKAMVGPTSRQEATGFVVNGKGYIGTGDNFSSGDNYGDFWEYDPLTDTWTQIEDFGGIARRYLSSFTIGAKAYCGTGTSGTNYRDFWEFDPALMVSTNNLNKPGIQVSVYPNPVATQFTVHINNPADNMQISVLNISGQPVFVKKQMQETTTIDCGNWENGNYIVQVADKTGKQIATQKIIVE